MHRPQKGGIRLCPAKGASKFYDFTCTAHCTGRPTSQCGS
ncbi:hypothetical protein HMPREF0262_01971 [Clostridium sp. ATCC 29733]|nr:hypothetical protein HMPREF0262_01971 [Clostridium sp. ATCC 29733]